MTRGAKQTGYDEHVRTWRSWWTHEIAGHLVGTCGCIPSAAETLGHPEWEDEVDAFELDSLAFECQGCGWWCSADECNDSKLDEWICDDCKRDEED